MKLEENRRMLVSRANGSSYLVSGAIFVAKKESMWVLSVLAFQMHISKLISGFEIETEKRTP
jgi:hypothetical protein